MPKKQPTIPNGVASSTSCEKTDHWLFYNIQFLFRLEFPKHQLLRHQMLIYNSNLPLLPFFVLTKNSKNVLRNNYVMSPNSKW